MAHKTLRGRKNPGKSAIVKKVSKKDKWLKKKADQKAQQGKAGAAAVDQAQRPAAKAHPGSKKDKRIKTALEKQHLALYAPGERILLVGEGNFSFALSMCRHFGEGPAGAPFCQGVYATAYDTDATLKQKYPDVDGHRQELEKKFGATTLVGVDATRLHKVKEFLGAFTTIVFNFPHLGAGEADVEKSVKDHRKLLHGFFASAIQCLSEGKGAKIHVALKTGEPYKSWKVAQTAQIASPGLDLQTAVPFSLTAFDAYAHRRTVGFDERWSKIDNEELGNGAKVYIFGRRKNFGKYG
jgi:hypothetical protein